MRTTADLDGPLHSHYATAYGLHRDSALNELCYFHATEELIPDIMHDCLEGCIQYEVKKLLRYLSSEGSLTVNGINGAIQSFPSTGLDARNWPAPITSVTLSSSDHSLKQKGLQLFCKHEFIIVVYNSYTDVVSSSNAATDDWETNSFL